MRTLSPEGGWTQRCANKDARPQREWIERSHIDWREEQVPASSLGPKGGWIVRSHIDWRGERVPTRTLGLEGEWIVRSHISWRGERSILYKGVETSP